MACTKLEHLPAIDHDQLNRERPFLVTCSCLDHDTPDLKPFFCGPWASLATAFLAVAFHLEHQEVDDLREIMEPMPVYTTVLTADEINAAYAEAISGDITKPQA